MRRMTLDHHLERSVSPKTIKDTIASIGAADAPEGSIIKIALDTDVKES